MKVRVRKELDTHRGVSHIEHRPGLAQVHVSLDSLRLDGERVRVLEVVAADGISLNFIKMTPAGMSFLIAASKSEAVKALLETNHFEVEVIGERSVVIAHAPNMRDEPGLIARIVRATILSGSSVDQVGDMHDRVLLVVPSDHAEHVTALLHRNLIGESE